MWLLTQDQQSLINLSKFDIICASDTAVGAAVIASKVGEHDSSVVIGRYNSDDDAQNTVQDIAKFIEDSNSIPFFADNMVVYMTK